MGLSLVVFALWASGEEPVEEEELERLPQTCYIDEQNNRVCEGEGDHDKELLLIPFPIVPRKVVRPERPPAKFGKEDMVDLHKLDFDNDRDCADRNPKCVEWAAEGECDNNPRYMKDHCAQSCSTCRFRSSAWRCRIDPELPAFVGPGDVDRMFENIIANMTQFKPIVLNRDPWLVVLDEFLTDEEVEGFLKRGAKNLKRSVDAGAMGADGKFKSIVSDARTSENAWCVHNCYEHDEIQAVNKKISAVTGIPQEAFEYHQVLRYQPGQYYVQHHDYIFGHLDLPIGPRVYTFFLYLSDVEEGGETNFPILGHAVKPKRGRAVVWPSVMNDDPFKKDPRTKHEAKPVIKGLKFAANSWIHMFDFHSAFSVGCSG